MILEMRESHLLREGPLRSHTLLVFIQKPLMGSVSWIDSLVGYEIELLRREKIGKKKRRSNLLVSVGEGAVLKTEPETADICAPLSSKVRKGT